MAKVKQILKNEPVTNIPPTDTKVTNKRKGIRNTEICQESPKRFIRTEEKDFIIVNRVRNKLKDKENADRVVYDNLMDAFEEVSDTSVINDHFNSTQNDTQNNQKTNKTKDQEIEDIIDKCLLHKLRHNSQALKEYSLRKIKHRQDTYMNLNERLDLADERKTRGKINYYDNSVALYLKPKKDGPENPNETDLIKNLPEIGKIYKDVIEI